MSQCCLEIWGRWGRRLRGYTAALPVLMNYTYCVGTYARAKKAPQEILRSLNIITHGTIITKGNRHHTHPSKTLLGIKMELY